MAEILDCCLKPRNKTMIMCEAYLSHKSLNHYVSLLMDKGLLSYDDGKREYVTSERGKAFLANFRRLAADLPEPTINKRRQPPKSH